MPPNTAPPATEMRELISALPATTRPPTTTSDANVLLPLTAALSACSVPVFRRVVVTLVARTESLSMLTRGGGGGGGMGSDTILRPVTLAPDQPVTSPDELSSETKELEEREASTMPLVVPPDATTSNSTIAWYSGWPTTRSTVESVPMRGALPGRRTYASPCLLISSSKSASKVELANLAEISSPDETR